MARAIGEQIEGIDDANFKNSVKEAGRHDAYCEAWRAMLDLQRASARKSRR